MGEKEVKLFLEIENAISLLEKIEIQFAQFQSDEKLNRSYLLWDIILSLNHLPEWILMDKQVDESIKFECMKHFNPYDKIEKAPQELKRYIGSDFSQSQFVIREIANSTKHFVIKKSKLKKKKIHKGFWGYPGNEAFMSSPLQNGYFTEIEKYIVERDNENYDLVELLSRLISDWNLFFSTNKCYY